MAGTLNINVFVGYLICFSFICNVLSDADECVKKDCKCEFANGTGIDLTPSVSPTFYQTKTYKNNENGSSYSMTVYNFHPCGDIQAPVETGLKYNLSVFRYKQEMKQVIVSGTIYYTYANSYEWLGNISDSIFSKDGAYIKYTNKPSNTTIYLICAQTTGNLSVISEEEPNSVILAFYSRNACLTQIEDVTTSNRSLGSTLLIIFFSCVIFYLVLGILTKKFLMGATGIEVIPNLGFWTDLPGLCKDGWLFIRNGFKVTPRDRPSTGQDPNSYDSI